MTAGVKFPGPLQEKEEEALAERAFEGDQEAKNALVEHNMRLVFFVANKFKNSGHDVEDLASVGSIGLIKAVNTFDPRKKNKLSTYASMCIRNEILMHLRKGRRRLETVSLQETVSRDKEGNELSLMDTLGCERGELERGIVERSEASQLKKLIRTLPERERMIIEFRYGIDRERMKQTDVSEIFEISQSYISRIEKTALKKLRKKIEAI